MDLLCLALGRPVRLQQLQLNLLPLSRSELGHGTVKPQACVTLTGP